MISILIIKELSIIRGCPHQKAKKMLLSKSTELP